MSKVTVVYWSGTGEKISKNDRNQIHCFLRSAIMKNIYP